MVDVGNDIRTDVDPLPSSLHPGLYRQVVAASPVAIGVADENGHFVAVNPALCRLFGRPAEQLLGRSSLEWTHPDDRAGHADAGRLIDGSLDGIARVEKRFVHPDGQIRWAWLTFAHMPGPAGQTWTVAHMQDVTERHAVDEELRASQANLTGITRVLHRIQSGADARQSVVDAARDIADAAHAMLVEPTADRQRLECTASTLSHIVGASLPVDTPTVTGQAFRGAEVFLADPATDPNVDQRLHALAGSRSSYVLPVEAGGQVIGVLFVGWMHLVDTLDDRRARAVKLLAAEAGVAIRQASLVSSLSALARTDTLTGLLNRRAWDDATDYLLAAARRTGNPLVVAMVDLDHFKAYNDRHGHVLGDELLSGFATAMRSNLRDIDVVARWGGEEFAVVLPACTPADAQAVLERVRQEVPAGQTCSIGYARWDRAESRTDLLHRADRALYAAKAGGRDRLVYDGAEG